MQYGYTYKRGRQMSDSEIDQAGAAAAESAAQTVNFYRDESTGEIVTLCAGCVAKAETTFTYIDKAGDWDICNWCEAQNVPDGWSLV